MFPLLLLFVIVKGSEYCEQPDWMCTKSVGDPCPTHCYYRSPGKTFTIFNGDDRIMRYTISIDNETFRIPLLPGSSFEIPRDVSMDRYALLQVDGITCCTISLPHKSEITGAIYYVVLALIFSSLFLFLIASYARKYVVTRVDKDV